MPYGRQHVERYHQWLQDEHLLHLTGTEPGVTLAEEYVHQQAWEQATNSKNALLI